MQNARICPSCIGFPILHLLRNICNHLELIKADKQLEETDPEKFYQDLDVADLVLGEDADQLGGLIAGEEFSRLVSKNILFYSTGRCRGKNYYQPTLRVFNKQYNTG